MAKMCADQVAVVTGAAGKGMGRSIALTLAREGAAVVVNYRTSEANAHAIVDHIRGRGGKAIAVQADVCDAAACERLVAAASQHFGPVDICIVGPGAGWHPGPPHDVNVQTALDDARCELAPLYALMRALLPGMYERRRGRLIAISLLPPYDSPAYTYNVAKVARTHAAGAAGRAAWPHGVTVNTIAPGPVDAIETLAAAVELCDHGPAWQNRANVTPQDIAEGVAFLCSDAGRFISACELPYLYT